MGWIPGKIQVEKVKNLKSIDKENYNFDDYPGPVIIIDDDGIGMDKNIIELGWLRPASPLKTQIKERLKLEKAKAIKSGNLASFDAVVKKIKKEHGNRIPLGEKGVGRFATHRLGQFLELRTKTKDIDYELVLKVDWNKFDDITDSFVDLDSIGISLTREQITRNYNESNSGTRLIIYGGKSGFDWDSESILDLNRTILNLNSPTPSEKRKTDYNVFNASLECPQIEKLPEKLVFEESEPNFELAVIVNEDGIAEISELRFKHPRERIPSEIWEETNWDLRRYDTRNRGYWKNENGELRTPECGPFYLNISSWYRLKEWIDIASHKDLIDYLDEFGGISIYRDNILIYDAKLGAEIDWLGLSKRHIKQGFRMSYRDMIGNIEIEQHKNFNLIDKTNREGFINNRAFKDLSILVGNIVDFILLPRYRGKRDEFANLTKGIITDAKTLGKVVKDNDTFLGNISKSNYPFEEDPYTFFRGLSFQKK